MYTWIEKVSRTFMTNKSFSTISSFINFITRSTNSQVYFSCNKKIHVSYSQASHLQRRSMCYSLRINIIFLIAWFMAFPLPGSKKADVIYRWCGSLKVQNFDGTSLTPCLNFSLLEGLEPIFFLEGGDLDTTGGNACRNKSSWKFILTGLNMPSPKLNF